tara:strand:+ start:578 stop:739 length:162 start_codon:yes stop_codon:yes gene_type:complete
MPLGQLNQIADGSHLSHNIELKVNRGSDPATYYSGELDINLEQVKQRLRNVGS